MTASSPAPDTPPPDPLTRAEFRRALHRGLGRALRHARYHGLGGMEDLLLDACLHNRIYDQQCEESRSDWLFEILSFAPDSDPLSRAVVDALDEEEIENGDLHQRLELAALVARAGDSRALESLRRRVLALVEENAVYTDVPLLLIDCQGLEAVVALARVYGRQCFGAYEIPPLNYLLRDHPLFTRAWLELRRLARTDADIAAYLRFSERHERHSDARPGRRRARPQPPAKRESVLESVLSDAANGVGPLWEFSSRARKLTPEQREYVFARMLAARSADERLRLLSSFRSVRAPYLHPELWILAEAADEATRETARTVLSRFRDDVVGDYARNRIDRGAFAPDDVDLLRLLEKNHRPGDVGRIHAALERLTLDDEQYHEAGSCALNIVGEHAPGHAAPLLRWVYETTPCSMCREDAVRHLVTRGEAEPVTLVECLDDAVADTRELARKALGLSASGET